MMAGRHMRLVCCLALLAVACAAPAAGAAKAAPAAQSGMKDSMETHEQTLGKALNGGRGKITIVSNINSLAQMEQPPTGTRAEREEAGRKKNEEAMSKRTAESKLKLRAEELQKKSKQAMSHKQRVEEEGVKRSKAEQLQKQAEEETAKAKVAAEKEEQSAKKRNKDAIDKARKLKEQKEQEKKHRSESDIKKREEKRRKNEEAKRQKESEITLPSRSCANFGGFYGGVGVSAVVSRGDNICYLSGLLRGACQGVVAVLPKKCRPVSGRLVFSVLRNGAAARLDVLADGRVLYVTGGGSSLGGTSWMSLDGVSFSTQEHSAVRLVWGWQAYGHGYREPFVMQNDDGVCIVSGLIKNGRWGYFAQVPRDCAPTDGRLIFSTNNHGSVTRTDVLTNGFVLRAGGSSDHNWVSLDGLQWVSGNGGTNLALVQGWLNFGRGYREGKYKVLESGICMLSGLIRHGGTFAHLITTLPTECRPQRRLVFGVNVHEASARVDVFANGEVHYVAGQRHDWLALDGIRFATQQFVDKTKEVPKQADSAVEPQQAK